MSFPIAHIGNQQGRGLCMAHSGNLVAEMMHSRVNDKQAIVGHTRVDDRLTGLGVVRASGIEVLATCPYAAVQPNKGRSIAGVRG